MCVEEREKTRRLGLVLLLKSAMLAGAVSPECELSFSIHCRLSFNSLSSSGPGSKQMCHSDAGHFCSEEVLKKIYSSGVENGPVSEVGYDRWTHHQ